MTLYKERDDKKRALFLEQIARYSKESLVYVDESGIDCYVGKSHGWAPRGKKIIGEISGKCFARESFIAAKCCDKILASYVSKVPCNTALFEIWVQDLLVPALVLGQVVILDNATFHKSEATRRLIEDSGCHLLFLPPYSPDFNPIEKFWAWFKAKIKTIINNFKPLQQAIDYIFSLQDFQLN
ncbi:MAG: IS630 family transposase [Candidatus Paracaedibacteraceae bacterium]|nr:IS630 family transposase [Candidatus Paracaedibacteraceae bacterium]